MSRTIADLQESTVIDDQDEILFYQNSTKVTKKVKRANFFSSRGIVVRGRLIDPEGNDVGLAAATAEANALIAIGTANNAQTSADGKTKVYYQTTAPTGGTYNSGDLWYDTDDNYKVYVYSSGNWAPSFTPFPGIDVSGNVTGLVKATGTESTFALLANKFQIIDPANPATKTEANVPFEIIDGNVRIKNAQIQTVDAGKLTAGFMSSQVIELANSNAYIQSRNFVITWVNGIPCRVYNGSSPTLGKVVPSDNVVCKVLQNDGKFKTFRCLNENGSTNAPPASGSNTWWQEVANPTITVNVSGTNKTIDDFGFRIVGQGQAEFGGVLVRGAIVANEGFFGDTVNAVRIDDEGMVMGNFGRIKTAGIGYNGTDFTSTAGSGGFFLGNTQAEGQAELYQFFIGDPSGNNLRWNGTDLRVNGRLSAYATGTSGAAGFGLIINSGFGIRREGSDKVLTITGGEGNGVTNGAQIDLCGSSATGLGGFLILQAGSGVNSEIRLNTNVANGDPNSGTERLVIKNTGLIKARIEYSGNSPGPVAVTSGAGCIHAEGNIGVGVEPDVQNSGGSNNGKLWFTTEAVLYDGDTRLVLLKKLDGNGMIYLRDSGDSVTVTLDGGAGEITASSYNSTSSKRFKKKIKNLKNGLNLVTSLRPVTFDWKKKEKKDDIGLIAEEVYKILPSVVKLDEDDLPCAIDYSKLTPILIQAVKELYAEIHALKSKIKL
jgi:hypothetical protein